MLSSKTYADYIATRPRVQKFGTHGLFTDEGVAENLREVSKKLNAHTGNVWTAIVSLRREDAERLGFNSGERWRDMLRSQANTLATEFHIPMQHLKWYAAFHNEGHHPHIHMIIYSDYEKQGFLTKKGVENLRSSFATQIFAQDLQSEYKKQTKHRDELRQTSREVASDIIARITDSTFDNPELELKLLLLSEKLNGVSGKKQYGFLPADLKNLVDSIVDDLAKDPRIAELYDLWYEDKEEIIRTYTEHMPKRIPLSQNKEFRNIQNCVIKEALLLKTESTTEEKTASSKPFDNAEMSEPVFKSGKAHNNPTPEIHHTTYESRQVNTGSVIRLVANATRIIQDKLPGNHNIHNPNVDRRIRKQIRDKKIAHGQKQE